MNAQITHPGLARISHYQSSLVSRDGEVFLLDRFIAPEEAAQLTGQLCRELDWHAESLVLYGREISVPRRVCWYGDAGAIYTYSGVTHTPLPWPPLLTELRRRVQSCTGQNFNSVLGNFYRDGNDSMGWHADKERELGRNPVIASLSFGAQRLFKLRHNKSGETVEVYLPSGSLLLMGGALQHHWRHCLPKMRGIDAPRVNLTFRYIPPR